MRYDGSYKKSILYWGAVIVGNLAFNEFLARAVRRANTLHYEYLNASPRPVPDKEPGEAKDQQDQELLATI